MALPINVKELIDNRVVESTRIEYKADWDPEPIIHSITAFANDGVYELTIRPGSLLRSREK